MARRDILDRQMAEVIQVYPGAAIRDVGDGAHIVSVPFRCGLAGMPRPPSSGSWFPPRSRRRSLTASTPTRDSGLPVAGCRRTPVCSRWPESS
jgi:hypothetical protein